MRELTAQAGNESRVASRHATRVPRASSRINPAKPSGVQHRTKERVQNAKSLLLSFQLKKMHTFKKVNILHYNSRQILLLILNSH